MRNRKPYAGIAAGAGMLVLILDSKTALEGARTGLDLCIRTVIPSLFPFFVLSTVVCGVLMGTSLRWLRPLGKLCGLPRGAEALLIPAFLGGYPVGAQAVAAAWQSGALKKADAERALGFCSNAGPAFLFGMVAAMFQGQKTAWLLWLFHITGAVLTAVILPGKSNGNASFPPGKGQSLSAALHSSIRVMAGVCGWVVLFRILIAFLSRWILWMLPVNAQVIISGLLELSNGCCALWKIPEETTRILAASAILSLGGVCVTMQTVSVTTGLSLKHYFTGKMMQSAFSLLLWIMVLYSQGYISVILALFALILRKTENRGSIQPEVVV